MTVNPDTESRYNARAAIPDHPRIFEDWQARSAAVRKSTKCQLDIEYGHTPRQAIDLFPAPHLADGAPLLVFLHGGYWQALDKSFFSFLAPPLIEAGIALAVAGYDLCPDVEIDEIVDQTRRAAAFLWLNAEAFGIDPKRILVAGHSAGGHMAAMALAADWPDLHEDLPTDMVAGAVSISGVFELSPLIDTSMNDKLALDADKARRNSPVYMEPAAAPLVLAVGADENAGFHDQAQRMAEAWGDRVSELTRIILPGCHHLAAVEQLAEPTSELFAAVKRLAFAPKP